MTDKLTGEELNWLRDNTPVNFPEYDEKLRRLLDEHAELTNDHRLLWEILEVLGDVAADHGESEGAVDCVKRIIADRAELKANLSANDRCGASRQELLAQISGLRADWDTLKDMLDAARHAKKVAEMQRDEFAAASTELRAKLAAAEKERDEQRSSKDFAYSERNKLVALISKIFPSALGRHSDLDTAWENDWRWIVFVTLPTGQASWHIHDSDLPLFAHLKREAIEWDGHTTEEKYRRIEQVSIDCILSGNENVRARREALMAGEDPSLDGTPNAHPAFWRGIKAATQAIERFRSNFLDSSTENAVCRNIAQMLRELTTKKDGG